MGWGGPSLTLFTVSMHPPQDPLEQFGISEEARFQLSSLPTDGRTACIGSQLDVLD